MKQKIRYREHFAPIGEEEMVYLHGGSLFEDVGIAVDDAVVATNKTLANRWLDNNADGNIFTILGRAVDDLGADMSKSVSYFARDLVAAGMVVALWPISIPVLLII